MDTILSEAGLLVGFAFSLGMILVWVAALISVIRNEFHGENEKLVWALLVIFVPVVGTILYFTIGIKRIKPL